MKEVWNVNNFDIVLGNPPFNQMIDLKFLEKSYQISEKVLFVHPSTWLLDEKNKQKKFINAKELIKDHLVSIKLFNGNGIFGISLFVPCVITYIDKHKEKDDIFCIDEINEVELKYDDIYQINKYSNIDEYISIKNKISTLCNINMWSEKYKDGNFYINISQIRGHVDLKGTNMLQNDFYTLITKDEIVLNERKKHLSYGFYDEHTANNFLKFLKTNFVRFCLSILKNNSQLCRGELSLIPWLDFSQECTDKKLYKHFNITEDEIKFIEKHIPKYY
jgi:hypothetical protein